MCARVMTQTHVVLVISVSKQIGKKLVVYSIFSKQAPTFHRRSTAPAYGVYISQLVRIGRICDEYSKFAGRNYAITSRLVKQGFRYNKLHLNVLVTVMFPCFRSLEPVSGNTSGMASVCHCVRPQP